MGLLSELIANIENTRGQIKRRGPLSLLAILGEELGRRADAGLAASEKMASVVPEVKESGRKAMTDQGLGLLGAIKAYHGSPAPRDAAMKTAQKNAAKPIEKGGLGLPPNNTAEDRARAMGFNYDLIHGSSNDIQQVDLSKLGANTSNSGANGPGFYMSELPWHSELYAGKGWGSANGANLMPLKVRFDSPFIFDGTKNKLFGGNTKHPLDAKWWESGHDGAIIYRPGIKGKEAEIIEAVTNKPSNVRSRFAAFDPARRNSNDLLASAGGIGLLGLLASLRNDGEE